MKIRNVFLLLLHIGDGMLYNWSTQYNIWYADNPSPSIAKNPEHFSTVDMRNVKST